MEELVFDSSKAQDVFDNIEGADYVGSTFNVDKPCVLDLFYKGDLTDIKIYLIKRYGDTDKIMRNQPQSSKIGLGNMENGIFDRIIIKDAGNYLFASRKDFERQFKNVTAKIVKNNTSCL